MSSGVVSVMSFSCAHGAATRSCIGDSEVILREGAKGRVNTSSLTPVESTVVRNARLELLFRPGCPDPKYSMIRPLAIKHKQWKLRFRFVFDIRNVGSWGWVSQVVI